MNYRIRRVAANNIITTFAGTGGGTLTGEDTAATSTNMNIPYSVTGDSNGNIYYSDLYFHRVRKISAGTFLVTTIVGSVAGAAGAGSEDVPGTSAMLYHPHTINVDTSGNILIADAANHRIRLFTASTGIVKTIIGTGTAGYNGDNILAVNAQVNYPISVWKNSIGDIFFGDLGNQRIRMISTAWSGNMVTSIAGTGDAGYDGEYLVSYGTKVNSPHFITGLLILILVF
jgi:hypothetical protein